MKNLNTELQSLFNTVTKTGTVNDSYLKRITRFEALFTNFDEVENGFKLTGNDGVSFQVTKYQLLGLVIENPAKLDSIAVRKGGVDNTMLSYTAFTSNDKQAVTTTTAESLLERAIKHALEDDISNLKTAYSKLSVYDSLLAISKGQDIAVNDTVINVDNIISFLNTEKYKEQLNKFTACFNSIKSDSEALETGNSKQLQVTLFDSEIVDNKIVALYKATDTESKSIINARLTRLGFTGIKWAGNTNLTVNL